MNQVAARVSTNASMNRRGSAQRDVLNWRASLVSESPNGENARVLTLAMWARWMFRLRIPQLISFSVVVLDRQTT
jgi:hypothetical protein